MQVVVYQPRGVLEVQAFGENIGGNQYACFRLALCFEFFAGGIIVIRCERLNYIQPIVGMCIGVNLDHIDKSSFLQLLKQISGGVLELREDQTFVFFEYGILGEELLEGSELLVLLWLELFKLL